MADRDKHERPMDVWSGRLFMVLAGLAATIAAALLVSAAFYEWGLGKPPGELRPPVPATFPQPRLQIDPEADLARLRAREKARLEKNAATPIERAMALIAARGAAAYDPLPEQKP